MWLWLGCSARLAEGHHCALLIASGTSALMPYYELPRGLVLDSEPVETGAAARLLEEAETPPLARPVIRAEPAGTQFRVRFSREPRPPALFTQPSTAPESRPRALGAA